MCELFGGACSATAMVILFFCMVGGMLILASLITNLVGIKMLLSKYRLKFGLEPKGPKESKKEKKEKEVKTDKKSDCNSTIVLFAIGFGLMCAMFAVIVTLVVVL